MPIDLEQVCEWCGCPVRSHIVTRERIHLLRPCAEKIRSVDPGHWDGATGAWCLTCGHPVADHYRWGALVISQFYAVGEIAGWVGCQNDEHSAASTHTRTGDD